ncbi:MAG: Asp-tRNA(Asn)/Glu-tRNA(Gln) amidotransferase subunit GatC [Gemmatimonadales bacterium]
MKIGPDDVRHVARLAELAVADADLVVLATQLEGIVNFVAQLDEVAVGGPPVAVVIGPQATRLRADAVDPVPLDRGPAEFAPAFHHGFFVVPRLGGLADE